MGLSHYVAAEHPHYAWDNALPPVLEVEPGECVTLHTRDSCDHYFSRQSTSMDVRRTPPFRGHPLTGPILIKGAQPGDILVVDIVEVAPDDWGWTVVLPGRGLLPDDFSDEYLRIWDLSGGRFARWHGESRFSVPIEPFCGVMGVALDEPGPHSTNPPRRNGGNMDVKQLVAGTQLYLPVLVPGALFSAGDAHAAQGDGEVCVTAIEMSSEVTVRLDLRRDFKIAEPQMLVRRPLLPATNVDSWYATTAAGPDLMAASQQAVRYLIDYLVREHGMTRVDAYILASVAADLKISEVVDAPNWLVSAFLPLSIFDQG
jgi:acetamidase/formamidase